MKSEEYFFHQTPSELAKDLLQFIPIENGDRLYEPFKGEGSFYNNFPVDNPKDWSEIEEGRDYKDYNGEYDWVISNPPFKLNNENGRENSFWYLLNYYTQRAKKGIAFVGNDNCFSTLTPKRLKGLEDRGWFVNRIVVSSVKKWRGRYFFMILTKNNNNFYKHLVGNY